MARIPIPRIAAAGLAAALLAVACRSGLPREAVTDIDPPDCPAYVKEPTPPWAAPFLGRFGIPDPWPKDQGRGRPRGAWAP